MKSAHVIITIFPLTEPEAKPQSLTEDGEKKKQKKPKKTSNAHSNITGFQQVFEQFAGVTNSKGVMATRPEVGKHLTTSPSGIPADSKLDVSVTLLRLFLVES